MSTLMSLAPFFILLALFAGIGLWIATESRKEAPGQLDDAVWAQALGADTSGLSRAVLGAAKPLSKLPPVYEAGTSRQYATLATTVAASGRWGGSLEVFLSVQALALLVGLTTLALGWAFQPSGLALLGVLAFGVLIAVYPFGKTREAAKKRQKLISENLPDFAEVLLMSLTAGQSVMAALRFTASTPDARGPVADEVAALMKLLDLQRIGDKEVFDLAGHRLGTPESVAFFNALSKAHIDGSKVVETIQSQAKSLRVLQFQRARSQAKKMPTKLMLISFGCLMLSIFALAFLPFVVTMQSVGT